LPLENKVEVLNVTLLRRLCDALTCRESFPSIINHCINIIICKAGVDQKGANSSPGSTLARIAVYDCNIVCLLIDIAEHVLAGLK